VKESPPENAFVIPSFPINQVAAQELGALPGVDVIELDVTSDASVQEAITKSIAKYGRIDVLINNAGVAGFGLAEAYARARTMRIADGPDEVHWRVLARAERKRVAAGNSSISPGNVS